MGHGEKVLFRVFTDRVAGRGDTRKVWRTECAKRGYNASCTCRASTRSQELQEQQGMRQSIFDSRPLRTPPILDIYCYMVVGSSCQPLFLSTAFLRCVGLYLES